MNPALRKRLIRKEFLKAVAAGAALTGFAGIGVACEPSLSQKLKVEPGRLRADKPFIVRLSDLSPSAHVVLSVAFDDGLGNEWSSTAVFEADGEGRIDTSELAPAEGSYSMKDPMGLVWSAL